MKNLKAISIITVFLLAFSGSNVLAQGKPSKSSGARAAYGYPTEVKSVKSKKKKKKKQQKEPKRKAKAPFDRKKSPWVN